MLEVLADLPDGWSFGIDATDFPPGQAHIMVTGSGDIYGWSEYRSRTTLDRFGFEPLRNPLLIASHYLRGGIEGLRRSIRVRKLLNKNKANRVGAGIEPAPPTPPGMRVRTGRFPSVMAPEGVPLQGRPGTEPSGAR